MIHDRPRERRMVSFSTRLDYDLDQRLAQAVKEAIQEGHTKQDFANAAIAQWLNNPAPGRRDIFEKLTPAQREEVVVYASLLGAGGKLKAVPCPDRYREQVLRFIEMLDADLSHSPLGALLENTRAGLLVLLDGWAKSFADGVKSKPNVV